MWAMPHSPSRHDYTSHDHNSMLERIAALPTKDGTFLFYIGRVSTDQVAGFGSSSTTSRLASDHRAVYQGHVPRSSDQSGEAVARLLTAARTVDLTLRRISQTMVFCCDLGNATAPFHSYLECHIMITPFHFAKR